MPIFRENLLLIEYYLLLLKDVPHFLNSRSMVDYYSIYCSFALYRLTQAYGLDGGKWFAGSQGLPEGCSYGLLQLSKKTDLDSSFPLESTFSHLDQNARKEYFKNHALNFSETYFSYQSPSDPQEDLVAIRSDFSAALDRLTGLKDNPGQFAAMALAILERFGSTLALDDRNQYISLYDFAKIGSAIDACLDTSKEKLLLISGGLSGIQDYLYAIISKNASKSLKGRSFYLELLTDAITDHLLDALDLNLFHVIYASGGDFLIIAPDGERIANDLERAIQEVNHSFFKDTGNTLFVSHACERISKQDLTEKFKFSGALASLFLQQERRKQQKHIASIMEDPEDFFSKKGKAGLWQRDAVTGEELEDKKGNPFGYKLFSYGDEVEAAPEYVNKVTYLQIEMGRYLRNLRAILVTDRSTPFTSVLNVDFGFGNKRYHLLTEIPESVPVEYESLWYYFRAGEELPAVTPRTRLRYYGGNDTPYSFIPDEQDRSKQKVVPLSFNEMGGSGSFKRLGVLRMDVDNLGERVQSSKNLYELAALSRALDYFFKGYLNVLWKEAEKKPEEQLGIADQSVIIYSGGDDLFIVGRWDIILAIADEIREKFRKWVCYSSDYTISGGVAIITPKYPVMRAATMAGKAEKLAKQHQYQLTKKNAFTFLGVPLNWDNQYPLLKALRGEIQSYLQVTHNRSIFSRIAKYVQLYHEAEGKSGKWQWVTTYDLFRLKERLPKQSEIRTLVERWAQSCFSNHWEGQQIENLHFIIPAA